MTSRTNVSRGPVHRSQVPEMGPTRQSRQRASSQRSLDHVRKTGEPETFETIDLARPVSARDSQAVAVDHESPETNQLD